jgi:hypothetical protein
VVTADNSHRRPRITEEASSLIAPRTEIVHGTGGRSGTLHRNRAAYRGLPLKIAVRATKAVAEPTEWHAARKQCWRPARKPSTKENYPRRLNPLRLLASLVTATDVSKVVTLLTNSPKQLNHVGNQQTACGNLGSQGREGANVSAVKSLELSHFDSVVKVVSICVRDAITGAIRAHDPQIVRFQRISEKAQLHEVPECVSS